MGYYNDDYFKEFEGSNSGSRRRGAQRPDDRQGYQQNTYYSDNDFNYQRRASAFDRYMSDFDTGLDNGAYDNGAYDNSAYDNGAYDNGTFDDGTYDDGSYDLDGFGSPSYHHRNNVYERNGGAPADARRPAAVQRKRRLPRSVRRLLIVAGFLTVLIVMLTLIVAIIISMTGSGTIKHLEVAEVSSNRIVLQWEQSKKAEGYRVLMAKGDGDLTEYKTLNDPSATSVTVSDLEQATAYSFSVATLRGGKEGKSVSIKNVFTAPQAPTITNIYSAKKGSLHVDWTEVSTASGYTVEYKKDGENYTAESKKNVTDPAQCRLDITGLEVNANYSVRVYAYLKKDKLINSDPSAEVSVTVVAQDTEVKPKAMTPQVSADIDPNKPMIALTFDDGPAADGGDSSERILDVLEQYNAKATFFMVGVNAEANPANVKRKASLGMELGNHTWNHYNYGDAVTPDDIRGCSNKIYEITGQYPTCFRSPGGMTTSAILSECAEENMSAYYWSIDTEDWNSRDANAVYSSVMDHVQDGDIILMHEIYGSTADAVERMVPELIAKGFQLVTCHDLIALKGGSEPVPGVQYVDANRTMDPQ